MSRAFQDEFRFLGIEAGLSCVAAPQGNGVAERFFRTLEEQLLWLLTFEGAQEIPPDLGLGRQARAPHGLQVEAPLGAEVVGDGRHVGARAGHQLPVPDVRGAARGEELLRRVQERLAGGLTAICRRGAQRDRGARRQTKRLLEGLG